jgi:hypothetical protein
VAGFSPTTSPPSSKPKRTPHTRSGIKSWELLEAIERVERDYHVQAQRTVDLIYPVDGIQATDVPLVDLTSLKGEAARILERGVPTPVPHARPGRRSDDPLGGMRSFDRGIALRPAPEAPNHAGYAARDEPGDEKP